MLKQLGYASLDELTDTAVPDDIKLNRSAEAESILELQTVSQSSLMTFASATQLHVSLPWG